MSTDATVDLIRALIQNMRGAPDDWEALAMIVDFSDGQFSGTSGYAYSPEGVISAVASRPSAVRPAVDAYTSSHYKPGEALPVRLLVQFDRTKGAYEVTFEDTDETRWKVTPSNLETMREELRPRL